MDAIPHVSACIKLKQEVVISLYVGKGGVLLLPILQLEQLKQTPFKEH